MWIALARDENYKQYPDFQQGPFAFLASLTDLRPPINIGRRGIPDRIFKLRCKAVLRVKFFTFSKILSVLEFCKTVYYFIINTVMTSSLKSRVTSSASLVLALRCQRVKGRLFESEAGSTRPTIVWQGQLQVIFLHDYCMFVNNPHNI